MAGSCPIASIRSGNGPSPLARKVSCWASISAGERTFCTDVAKWLCQKNASFSVKGRSVATMRRTHQPASSTDWRRACF